MNKISFTILRVGLAITFLWIGVLIFKSPEGWGQLLQPWAYNLLPISLKTAMIGTAILDVVIGFMLLIEIRVWIFSLLGVLHLIVVLATTGINDITIRDIGLLAGMAALMIETKPKRSASVLK